MEQSNEGIVFKGVVVSRSRRYVGENQKELCTYRMLANGRESYIKHWQPNDDYLVVGEAVELPVYVKPYANNGRLSYDLILQTGSGRGEEF